MKRGNVAGEETACAASSAEKAFFKKHSANLSGMRKKRLWFVAFGISIPILNLLIFWLPTNLNSVLLAFEWTSNGVTHYGLGNFRMLIGEFKNPLSLISESLRNTLTFFSFNMFVQLPLAFLFSYFLYKKIHGYKIFRYIFYLPVIISSVVLSSIVLFMASPDGPITILWEKCFGTAPIFFADSRYAIKAMLVYTLWSGFGSSMIFYTAAMIRIPESVIEYGQLDGVNMFGELFKIVIPLVWPTLSVFILMGFVNIFSASGPILLFTQGEYGTYTLSFWIYAKTVGLSGRNLQYASAVGIFFTLLGTPIALFVKWLTDRIEAVEY